MRLIIVLLFSLICMYLLLNIVKIQNTENDNDNIETHLTFEEIVRKTGLNEKKIVDIISKHTINNKINHIIYDNQMKNDIKELKNIVINIEKIMTEMKDILQTFNNKFL